MASPAPTPKPPTAPVAPVAPKAAESSEDLWSKFKEFILIPFDKTILLAVPELGHLSPIIISMGAAFVALVTLNYPLGMLAASSVEAYLVYNALSTAGKYGATPDLSIPDKVPGDACKSHFQRMNPSRFDAIFSKGIRNEFPNSPLYYMCFAAAYCIQSMIFFSQETEELGPQYNNRPYLALISAGMFILLYTIFLVSYSCGSILSLLITIFLGLFVGYLICYQNYVIFGKNSVNLLFIPVLARRSGMDYLCVTTNPTLTPATIVYNQASTNPPKPKRVTLSWTALPSSLSYEVKFYQADNATTTEGSIFQTISPVSGLTADSTITLNSSKYYYGTVQGISSDGSRTQIIKSNVIQVPLI